MIRGTFRIYLGASPGVGKTFAMLSEARRRHDRGTDVVVGYVETHGRPNTAALIGDLEIVPRCEVDYRGSVFQEMDIDAILQRRPQVALIDELAHTNVPGSRNTKRWQDVNELLTAGIDVISTVNIQHLESINDVVETITGSVQRETIPDHVVRSADQIELVDMAPEALRRRMAHGNIYAPEKIDSALNNFFREGNLGALRELALLWVADQVDVALEDYRQRHGITTAWETKERVVVAITGAPGTADLLRRAARVAQRAHRQLLGVHVVTQHGLTSSTDVEDLSGHRKLLEEVGGEYHEVAGSDIAAALVDFARAENATQIVMGRSRLNRWQEITRGSVINRLLRLSGPIDVHVISNDITNDSASSLPRLPRRNALNLRRRWAAWILTLIGLPAFTTFLSSFRDHIGLPTVIVLYLLFVVIDAAIGGTAPALIAAVAGSLAVNWYFTPPIHTWNIAQGENVVALIVYLLTALIVSELVSVANRRSAEAIRASAEAQTLSSLATTVVDVDPLPMLMSHLRRSFGLQGVTLLRELDQRWVVEANDGQVSDTPELADTTHQVGPKLKLALSGRRLAAEDRRVLNAFADNLAAAIERRDLHAKAAHATALGEANELRSALLQAVSHDLRTPLAGIKASVNSLRQPDVDWSNEDRTEFLATIEDETDRLTNLVDNLLDMSRINADAIAPRLRATTIEEVVPAAVASLGPKANEVSLEVPETLGVVNADPALLERVVANLVDNALTHGHNQSVPVRVEAVEVEGRVLVRVIDRGKGIHTADHDTIFMPFQRLDDTAPRRGAGVGLGLAVARGFTQAMGGNLLVEETPGGGTTMVIELEVRR